MARNKHLLMAAVPLPGIAWPARQEVGRALVLDALWEAQQHPGVIISHAGPVRRAAQDTKHNMSSDIPCGS